MPGIVPSAQAEALEFTGARLVIEVLSLSTEAGDSGEKFIRYQGLTSFEEYILVDSRPRAVERLCRIGDGAWLYRRYSAGESVPFEPIGLTVPAAALYVALGLWARVVSCPLYPPSMSSALICPSAVPWSSGDASRPSRNSSTRVASRAMA
jgi:putative restriction endonuclease